MPKLVQEINSFQTGTIITPDIRDVPEDAAAYSYNLDSVTEDGVLKAVPKDLTTKTGVDAYAPVIINRDVTNRDLIYYDTGDNSVKQVRAINGVSSDEQDLGAITSNDDVSLHVHNKEVHIGAGSGSTHTSKWAGYIDFGQFGGAAPNTNDYTMTLEDAELSSTTSFPTFYKTVMVGDYIYGVKWEGTRVYKIKKDDASDVTPSTTRFKQIQGLATEDRGDLWLVDNGEGGDGTLYKISADDMGITQTTTLDMTGSGYPIGVLSDIVEVFSGSAGSGSNRTLFFSSWDSTEPWSTRGDNPPQWLWKLAVPSSSGNATLSIMNPTWDTSSYAESVYDDPGKWDSVVQLKIPRTPLVKMRGVAACGALVRAKTGGGNLKIACTSSAATSVLDGHVMIVTYYLAQGGGASTAEFFYHTGGTQSRQIIKIDSSVTNPIKGIWNDESSGGKLFICTDGNSNNLVAYESQGAYSSGTSQNNIIYYGGSDPSAVANLTASHTETDSKASGASLAIEGTGTSVTIRGADSASPKIWKWPYTSSGGFGTQIASVVSPVIIELTETSSGDFQDTERYFYSTNYVYDGYQEGTLGDSTDILPSGEDKGVDVKISIYDLSSLNKRISHLNLWRAKATDTASFKPDTFYRLCASQRLNAQWNATTDTFWGNYRSFSYTDNKTLGASYEAITQISEVVESTMVNYALSAEVNDHYIVGKCYHIDIADASRYLFKSKQGNFSQFDWTTDYLKLPSIPTALAAFEGRLYAFDDNNTYRINPDGFYIEDVFEGVGCLGKHAVVVSEYGMFFVDSNNLYLHNGQMPAAIGDAIVRGDKIRHPNATIGLVDFSWETKDTDSAYIPIVTFDSKRNSFIAFFRNDSLTGDQYGNSGYGTQYFAWAYNIARKRWDLYSAPRAKGVVLGKNGLIYISNGTDLATYMGSNVNQDEWEYITKPLHMDSQTQQKKFYKIEARYKQSGDNTTPSFKFRFEDASSWVSPSNEDFTGSNNTHYEGDITQSNGRLSRDVQVYAAGASESGNTGCEVDALAVVWRPWRKAARKVR
tara:strand:+ start:542 stop:3673 length:3132 start_codon:yes stop_codon:yes gene_type:complete